jgi:lipopolysaccharide export system protein LptC
MSMLPDRAARAFPLLLLGSLLVLAFLLNRMTELPYFNLSGSKTEPDLTIYHFTAFGYDQTGHLLYHLTADRMKHYPDESADLDKPNMRRTEQGVAPLTVTGDVARLTNRGDHVWFAQNVTMHDEGDAKHPPVTIRTTQLNVDVPSGVIVTEAPAVAESNGNILHTTGFDYNDKTSVLRTHSKGSIDYARPKH